MKQLRFSSLVFYTDPALCRYIPLHSRPTLTSHYSISVQQAVDSSHSAGSAGIIGFGPGGASNIQESLGAGKGDPVLDRIFRQNTSTPNYITILLGRAGDPSDTFVGDFTIGEVVDPFGNVTTQPKLDADLSRSHWVAQMDKNGIIGPDGQRINTTKHATGNKLNVMFDSGFTFPQVSTCVSLTPLLVLPR